MPVNELPAWKLSQREAKRVQSGVGRYLVQEGVPTPFGAGIYAYQEHPISGRRIIRHDRLKARNEWMGDGEAR